MLTANGSQWCQKYFSGFNTNITVDYFANNSIISFTREANVLGCFAFICLVAACRPQFCTNLPDTFPSVFIGSDFHRFRFDVSKVNVGEISPSQPKHSTTLLQLTSHV